jgi:Cu+-exporting ATPase
MSAQTELMLKIDGMHCASCVGTVERGVSALSGVESCSVNLATASAAIRFNRDVVDIPQIVARVRELGYDARIGQPDLIALGESEVRQARTRLTGAALLSVPLMFLAMAPMFVHHHPLLPPSLDAIIQALLALGILIWGGQEILRDAFIQTRHLRANMNSLIAMGCLAAFGWSAYATRAIILGRDEPLYFDSAGMIVTLILLGRYLEARSKRRAGSAIAALVRLRPAKATAVINGVELEIDAAAAQPGMILLVRPGDRIPADGRIIEGTATVDESMLTGESVLVEKVTGAVVLGGSVNGNSAFKLSVTATGEKSFLANVIRLVADAQTHKAPVQQLADRVASVFVPIVIAIAALTLIGWLVMAPGNPLAIKSVVAVLIIACPCALGLATPTAVLVGTGRAAKEGIIIRGGDILEQLSRINAVVFDKTGTLTTGRLEVVAVHSFGEASESMVLRVAGSTENQSEHPIAGAIVRRMRQNGIEADEVRDVVARPGFGIVATVGGQRTVIGTESHLMSERIDLAKGADIAQRERKSGQTVVFVALGGDLIGLIALQDRIKSESAEIVRELQNRFERVAMITGDNRIAAQAVAQLAGIEQVEAEVLPDKKQDLVKSYQQAGLKVAMVGDGINDAPALAAADVGIAMGSGTDVAIESADVVLIRPHLGALIDMFALSRWTMKIIRQNLFWAFAYNVVAIPIAAGALYPAFGLTLSPMIAALAMSMSSVFVVTNALRLNRVKL